MTPLKDASGMPLIIGVEIVERSSNTNATKKRAVRGVAGRNIANIYISLRVARVRRWSWLVVLSERRGVPAPRCVWILWA